MTQDRELTAAGNAPPSVPRMKMYRTIVADPPWIPTMSLVNGKAPKASPQHHYDLMTLDEITALDVAGIAAPQAHLYLWCLTQHADWGFEVSRAWGFEPVTMWTWCKPGLGAGRFRCNTEHVVVARRGSRHGNPFGVGGRHSQATDGTWFTWPRGGHSTKPSEFFEIVERLSPGPRVELFARQKRPEWDVWGNEAPEPRAEANRYAERYDEAQARYDALVAELKALAEKWTGVAYDRRWNPIIRSPMRACADQLLALLGETE